MAVSKSLFGVLFLLFSITSVAQINKIWPSGLSDYRADSSVLHKVPVDTLIVLKDTCTDDHERSKKILTAGRSAADRYVLQVEMNSPNVNFAVKNINAARPLDKADGVLEAVPRYKSDVGGIGGEVDKLKLSTEGVPDNAEALSQVAEKEAFQTNEIKALQQQGTSTKDLEKYRQAIEQYKDEKRIRQELKEKGRDLANDAIQKQQGRVDESMKKVKSANRKFDQVHDMRNLPTRAPNSMKGLYWRERLVPGVTFQFFENSLTWLEFDPQVYYKISGNWSAGLGGLYRFSLDKRHFVFDHFDNLFGVKAFVQGDIFKGFFIRSEGQFVSWKTWTQSTADPSYRNKTYVALGGIGKQYSLTSRIKGNVQTLYQFHQGPDPYKSRVIFRLGFDFSLRKKEVRDWEKNLRNRVKSANSIKR